MPDDHPAREDRFEVAGNGNQASAYFRKLE